MQPLHHPAVELNGTARGIFGPFERRDDLARLRDFIGRRREDRVTGFDLPRMNQRFTVEAEVAALRAYLSKTQVALGTRVNQRRKPLE